MPRDGGLPVVLSEQMLSARERRRDRWWSAGLAAWCGAFLWCCVATVVPARTVARVGGAWIMWWQLGLVLAAVGVVCLVTAVALAVRTAMLRKAELRVLPRRRRTGRVVATVLGGALLAATLGLVASVQGETLVTELAPASPDGCVVVVEESRGLMSGSGRVGLLVPGGRVPDWQGAYGSYDRYRPFTDGGYELRWRGVQADLALVDPSQPTGPQAWSLTC
jgi:hypothetical protein